MARPRPHPAMTIGLVRWKTQQLIEKRSNRMISAPSSKGKTPSLPRAKHKSPSFPQTENEILLRWTSLDLNANYLQMKSLNGFSDLQLGRYCFNLETEFSSQGFRNPRLKLAGFLQNNFLKMIIQQPSPILHSPFCPSLCPFPPLKYSFN